MATYNPPTENLPIFDPIVFITGDEPLTYNIAVKKFLKYPDAQGLENLQAINVNGMSHFNADVFVGSSGTANQTPVITTYKSKLSVGSGGNGLLDVECPISVGSFGSIQMISSVLNMSSNANIQQTGATTDNILSGTRIETSLGETSTPSFSIKDISGSKGIFTIPNASAGAYNPSIIAGDIEIYGKGSAVDTQTLALSTWSNTNSGIKIAPTSVKMGAGGATSTATTSVLCDGTNITFTSPNPPLSTATQPATNDNSNKIPTTAWVQSVISSMPTTQYTYTNKYVGNYPNGSPLTITIPTGCVKFDVILFGTGGLSTSYSIGVPDGGHPDYYYQIPATGGGAQVVKSTSSILIGKQGTNATNTMLLNTQIAISGGATGSQLSLNNVILAQAVNGNNATSFSNAGTATTSTHTTNSNYTSWIISQGNAGVGSNESYSSPNVGQLGGGNTYGGIAGAGSFGTNQQNASGAGQLYGSLSGPSYGLFVYPASPVNYGGCYITWYIQN